MNTNIVTLATSPNLLVDFTQTCPVLLRDPPAQHPPITPSEPVTRIYALLCTDHNSVPGKFTAWTDGTTLNKHVNDERPIVFDRNTTVILRPPNLDSEEPDTGYVQINDDPEKSIPWSGDCRIFEQWRATYKPETNKYQDYLIKMTKGKRSAIQSAEIKSLEPLQVHFEGTIVRVHHADNESPSEPSLDSALGSRPGFRFRYEMQYGDVKFESDGPMDGMTLGGDDGTEGTSFVEAKEIGIDPCSTG